MYNQEEIRTELVIRMLVLSDKDVLSLNDRQWGKSDSLDNNNRIYLKSPDTNICVVPLFLFLF